MQGSSPRPDGDEPDGDCRTSSRPARGPPWDKHSERRQGTASTSLHPTPTIGAAPTDNERSPRRRTPFRPPKSPPSYTTLAHGSWIDYISHDGGNQ